MNPFIFLIAIFSLGLVAMVVATHVILRSPKTKKSKKANSPILIGLLAMSAVMSEFIADTMPILFVAALGYIVYVIHNYMVQRKNQWRGEFKGVKIWGNKNEDEDDESEDEQYAWKIPSAPGYTGGEPLQWKIERIEFEDGNVRFEAMVFRLYRSPFAHQMYPISLTAQEYKKVNGIFEEHLTDEQALEALCYTEGDAMQLIRDAIEEHTHFNPVGRYDVKSSQSDK